MYKMMRLDKMLAHCGYGSRKEVKEYIRKGYRNHKNLNKKRRRV